MVKFAIALILISGVTTGTAYFYLPKNPQTPATAASKHQPEPSPRPGHGRERYHEPAMPLDVALFGLSATAFMGIVIVSNVYKMSN